MDLPPPTLPRLREADLPKDIAVFETALSRLSIAQLVTLSTTISAQLQAQAQGALSQTLLDYHHQTLDSPVLRSTPQATPSSAAADRPAPRPTSRQPQAWELLSTSNRLGPRLAAKLVVSSARSQAARRQG